MIKCFYRGITFSIFEITFTENIKEKCEWLVYVQTLLPLMIFPIIEITFTENIEDKFE